MLLSYIITSYVLNLILIFFEYIYSYVRYYREMAKYISDPSLGMPFYSSLFNDNDLPRSLVFIFSPLFLLIEVGLVFFTVLDKINTLYSKNFNIRRIIEKRLFKKYKALVVTHPDEMIRKLKDKKDK